MSKRFGMKQLVGLAGAVAVLVGVAWAGNRVFVRKVMDSVTVNTTATYSDVLAVSDYAPEGRFAAFLKFEGSLAGTGTVDYVKVQHSADSATWFDGPTIADDVAVTGHVGYSVTSYTNLTDLLVVAPYYRLAVLSKGVGAPTTNVTATTGLVVTASMVIH